MYGFSDILSTLAGLLPDNGMSFSERGAYALRMLVVGLAMVFAVLTVLWIVLSISKIFLHDIPGGKKANKKAKPIVAEQPPVAVADDGALIAVITAAIAAAMEAEGTGTVGEDASSHGFKVVSFRRAESGAWNRH